MSTAFKCVILTLFIAFIAASSDLKVNTYTKVEAYTLYNVGTWSSSSELIGGNGSALSLLANLDIDDASLTKGVNFEKGEVAPGRSFALDGESDGYLTLTDLNSDSQMVKIDSDLNIEATYTPKLAVSGFIRGFGCQLMDLTDNLWTCLTGTMIYQFTVTDSGDFTFQQSYTLDFSGSGYYQASMYVQKWLKTASGDYAAYGSTGNQTGIFLLTVSSDFSSVTAGWAFGALTLGIPEDFIEVEGIPGMFAITGSTNQDDAFVAYIDLMTATSINSFAFSTFDATATTTVSVASTSNNNFVVYTQDTVSYFQNYQNESFSNEWSQKLSSSIGECSVQGVFTQSNDNLVLMTLLPKKSYPGTENGPLQLAEMTAKKGQVTGDQDELTVSASGLTFTPIMYWQRGGAPAEVTAQTTLTKGTQNPWSSIAKSNAPSEEEVDVTPSNSISNPAPKSN